MLDEIESHHENSERLVVERFLEEFQQANISDKGLMLKRLRQNSTDLNFSKRDRKKLKKVYKQDLVKRSMLLKITAAWIITVPASGSMAAIIYFTLRGLLL